MAATHLKSWRRAVFSTTPSLGDQLLEFGGVMLSYLCLIQLRGPQSPG